MNAPRSNETPLTQAVRRGVWALTSLAVPGWALGAPSGGAVVAGGASIAQQGSKTTITQSTAKGAIEWQSFSIGANEYVQFVQPGTSAVTLNRVVGNDPSQLLGQLTANGQVFLVNPSGVYFGPDAKVDVAGLLATTFDISNADFLAGNYRFARVDGRTPAQVVNDGVINADGGYVILAGDGAVNHGLIEAQLGDIVLASGQGVTLDLGGDGLIAFAIDGEALTEIAGVENTGQLYADGGRVYLTAKVQGDLLPTAVNHEGLIQARTVEEKDGVVYLGGAGADVNLAGAIDANAGEANADGGKILVASTNDITLRDGTVISARGSGSGDGGVVRLIAKEVLDVEANTSVTTEGGATGQGGFVEVSGHVGLNVRGSVTPGAGGELLLDPSLLAIRAGAPTTGSGVTYNAFFDSTTVYESFIEGQLNTNVDVVLIASNSIGAVGSFGPTGAINATGSGDLSVRIGTISFSTASPAGSLTGANCGIGVCFGGVTSGSYTYTPGATGNIWMIDSGGNYVGIDIAGDVHLQPGTTNGFVDVASVRGATVTVDGDLRHVLTSSANPAQVSLTALSGPVTLNGDVLARNTAGDATVRVTGNGVVVNGAVIAEAAGGGNGSVDINAGAGVLNWNGPEIFAGDFNFLGCGTVGTNCFTTQTGFDSGATVSGLGLPSFTVGSGSASVTLQGATVNLNTPFAATPGVGKGARGFIGAAAGVNASLTVSATAGDLRLGASTNNAPLVGATVDMTGSIGGQARVTLDATGAIDVFRAQTPIFESLGGEARYYSVLADADFGRLGSASITGGSAVRIHGAKTRVAAHADGTGLNSAAAVVSLFTGLGNTDLVNPSLLIEGVLEATAENATSNNFAEVNTANNSGKTLITGRVEAFGSSASVEIYGSCGACAVEVRGELLAHTQASSPDNAWMVVSGNGITVNGGVVEARLGPGATGTASIDINASAFSVNDFVMSNGALIVATDNGGLGSAGATTGGLLLLPVANPGNGQSWISVFAEDILLRDNLGTVTTTEFSGSTTVTRTRLAGAIVADGGSAEVRLDATSRVDMGSLTAAAVPLVTARAMDDAKIAITGNDVFIRRTLTPFRDEFGSPVNVTLFSRALGRPGSLVDAGVDVALGFPGTGRLQIDPGARVHARAGDFFSTIAVNSNARASISFDAAQGTLDHDGALLAEARGASGDIASVFLQAFGPASSVNIAPGASLLARGLAGFGLVQATGTNVTLAGSAIAQGQQNASAFLGNSGSGSGTLLVDTTGVLEAQASSGNAQVNIASGTAGPTTVDVDGTVTARAGGSGNAIVALGHRGSLRVRGSLLADAGNSAQLNVSGSIGLTDLGGSLRAQGAAARINLNRSSASASGGLLVSGDLIADGATLGAITLNNLGGGATTLDPTANLQVLGTPTAAGLSFFTDQPLAVRGGALVDVPGTITMRSGGGAFTVDGTLRLRQGLTGQSINLGAATNSPLVVGPTGVIQHLAGPDDANVVIGGPAPFTSVLNQGVIEAVGGSGSQVLIRAGGIATASGSRISADSVTLIATGVGGSGVTATAGTIVANGLQAQNAAVSGTGGIQLSDPQVGALGFINSASGSVDITTPGDVVLNRAFSTGFGNVSVVSGGRLTVQGTVSFIGSSMDLTATGDVELIGGPPGGFSVNGDLRIESLTGDILLNSVPLTGYHVSLTAAGSVTTTLPSSIDALALGVHAGGAIDLRTTALTTHNLLVPTLADGSPAGDAQALLALGNLGGVVPPSNLANAVFEAPTVQLGAFDFFGDYLYLIADTLGLDQAIGTWLPGSEAAPVVNPDVVVQLRPLTPTRSIGVEHAPVPPALGRTDYSNLGHFQRFPGTSILLGGTGFGGPVNIGQNGTINLGGQNFLVLTSSTVTGGGNIVTTGLTNVVGAPPPPPPPTTTVTTTTGVTTLVEQTTSNSGDPEGSTIPRETVESNVPSEEQTAGDSTGGEPVDLIAFLERQPLVGGQSEVNNTVLACR